MRNLNKTQFERINDLRNPNFSLNMPYKAWFPPMRLTYSYVYSYENKYNSIGGNGSNNLKKTILQFP